MSQFIIPPSVGVGLSVQQNYVLFWHHSDTIILWSHHKQNHFRTINDSNTFEYTHNSATIHWHIITCKLKQSAASKKWVTSSHWNMRITISNNDNINYIGPTQFVVIYNKSSANAEISDHIELHWKCLFMPRRPVVTRGDSFWGRMALKLVITTLVCVKLVINLWRLCLQRKGFARSD